MKTTSYHSAEKSAPAELTREQKLNIIRNTILEENFTSEELCLPHTFDIVAVCAAIRTCPIKITTTKLTIIILLSSYALTQQQLLTLTGCEQSNLSHIITDLRAQGYITKSSSPHATTCTFSLTPQGKQLFTLFLKHYYAVITQVANLHKNAKLDD